LVLLQVRHWADLAAAAGQLLAQTLFARRPGVHVMHVTSEMVPVAKVISEAAREGHFSTTRESWGS
jgi:heme/copper-type cytochrome/quinol oxidase subunit 3